MKKATQNKINKAIKLLQHYEKLALKLNPNGYFLAFSGGKDFFRYEFAGYSLPDWENNPLVNEDSDTEYKVTDIEIEELCTK